MRVAIIDDSAEMLQILQSYVENNLMMEKDACDMFQTSAGLLGSFGDGKRYELYLLDVEMAEMSGFELAKVIRQQQKDAYIVFVTSHAELALESYEMGLKVYQYILKEQISEKLPQVLREIQKDAYENRDNFYVIQNKFIYEKIRIRDIISLYKDGKNSVFVMEDRTCRERKALKKVMQDLGKPEFIFVDSGRIVNINYIQRIVEDKIILSGGTVIRASNASIRKVKQKIAEYWKSDL